MKFSLHTALNSVQPSAYAGWPGWLNGPCGDAQSLAAVLALAGFQTQALINDDATLANYAAAVHALALTAKAGDLVILHHSHHGSRIDNGVFGGWSEAFCLSDGELVDSEWRKQIARFAPGVVVVAVLDCCHSGGMDRGKRIKAKPAYIPAAAPRTEGEPTPVACDFIGMSACQSDETCIEDNIPELTEVRGIWSYALTRALESARAAKMTFTLRELFDFGRRYCVQHYPAQHARLWQPRNAAAINTRLA